MAKYSAEITWEAGQEDQQRWMSFCFMLFQLIEEAGLAMQVSVNEVGNASTIVEYSTTNT